MDFWSLTDPIGFWVQLIDLLAIDFRLIQFLQNSFRNQIPEFPNPNEQKKFLICITRLFDISSSPGTVILRGVSQNIFNQEFET